MKVAALDFDETVARYNCGAPITEVLEAVRMLHARGYYILVHTSRVNEHWPRALRERNVREMTDWLEAHDVPYDDIWRERGKPLADCYIEDLAVIPRGTAAQIVEQCEAASARAHVTYGELEYEAAEALGLPGVIAAALRRAWRRLFGGGAS